jgi:iron complex transport system ATP-binding protein
MSQPDALPGAVTVRGREPEHGTDADTHGDPATDGGADSDPDRTPDSDPDRTPDADPDRTSDADPDRTSVAGAVIIELTDVVVRRSGRTVLGPISWSVGDGERWVILGRNGCGKTTLLSVASMNLWPSGGSVEVLGERYGRTDSRELRRRVGYAGSSVEAQMTPELTPRILIETGRYGAFGPWWHAYTKADHERAAMLGELLGLHDHLDQPFGTLSAGERRRTSIARALMPDPEILLLDEPAASLDLAAREWLLHDLERLAGEARPRVIVLVSHHLEEIPRGFERGLVMADGRAVATGPLADVLRDDVLGTAFSLPLAVERRDGRWSARMRR